MWYVGSQGFPENYELLHAVRYFADIDGSRFWRADRKISEAHSLYLRVDIDYNEFICKELRFVTKVTGQIDAASILPNLTEYRVISNTQTYGFREARIKPVVTEASWPSWDVLTTRIKTRPMHRVNDVPVGDTDKQVLVRKRRMACQ